MNRLIKIARLIGCSLLVFAGFEVAFMGGGYPLTWDPQHNGSNWVLMLEAIPNNNLIYVSWALIITGVFTMGYWFKKLMECLLNPKVGIMEPHPGEYEDWIATKCIHLPNQEWQVKVNEYRYDYYTSDELHGAFMKHRIIKYAENNDN